MGQKEYEGAIAATAFKAGVVVERERVRELLKKWDNRPLQHREFMLEFDDIGGKDMAKQPAKPKIDKQKALRDEIARAQGYEDHAAAVAAFKRAEAPQ